jgi:hypothetical protein
MSKDMSNSIFPATFVTAGVPHAGGALGIGSRQSVSRKPISVEVRDDSDGRFVILTYANGDIVRERVDPEQKPTRRPRRPPTKLGLEELDKTRRKRI